MKKLLLTGFGPFLTNTTNPTQQIVTQLHQQTVGKYEIEGMVLPVVFEKAGQTIIEELKLNEYNAIIMLGLAANRKEITPERVAINCRDGKTDNAQNSFEGEKIHTSGPDGIFTTLPIQEMIKHLKENGLSASISNSAGTYVCNDTMYLVNLFLKENGSQVPSGFIHVPEASSEKELNDLIKGIKICIEVLE